jgi:hypothetical protein
LIMCIQSLLCDPNPYHPLEPEIAQLYVSDREQHDIVARKWALDYAQSFHEFLLDELASDTSPQIPYSWHHNIPKDVASEFNKWRETTLNDAQKCFIALFQGTGMQGGSLVPLRRHTDCHGNTPVRNRIISCLVRPVL